MTIDELVLSVQNGTIQMQDIAEAKERIEIETEGCVDVIQDNETQWHVRTEYQQKLALYRKTLNRL